MGNGRMNPKIKDYTDRYYPEVKSDLFSVFFIKCCEMAKQNGYLGFMSPFVWMFIKSYEELRKKFINEKYIVTLTQLEYSGFEDATVPICTFVLQNSFKNKKGEYIKLSDFKGAKNQPIKTLEAIENPNCGWRYQTYQKDFEKIPSSPIAYWVSERVREIFEKSQKLENVSDTRLGMATADNNEFLRLWNEVNYNKVGFGMSNSQEALESQKKWFPYAKGGEFRKWYGNQEYLVNWENGGYKILNFKDKQGKVRSHNYNLDFIFKEGLTWSALSSSKFSIRLLPTGFLFDNAGSSLFMKNSKYYLKYLLFILNNSKIQDFLILINPTLNYQPGNLNSLPIIFNESLKEKIDDLVQQNINIAKKEWDSRETSWDFEKLFIASGSKISESYNKYCNYWRDNFVQMHKNEEELNKLFIDIYELNDEMDEKVPFEDITLLKNETKITEILTSPSIIDDTEEREKTSEDYLYNRGVNLEFNKEEIIKQFLSYAVGCIIGRYSIDKNGLIMANSDDVLISSDSLLLIKDREGNIRHEIENPRFLPDDFGIIPITSENVFANDIVTKVFDFVKALYGEENFEENIDFICEALGKKENDSCENILRNYFIKDFYTDHLKRYQKRPIYWLFNSGKKNGFQALVYLHRYQDDTIGRLRAEYLLPYQEKMENLKDHYERIVEDESTVARDRKIYEKALKELNGMLLEIKNFANDVKHIVEQKISIDLDDGVKVNYEKFGSVLKKI